MKTKYIIILLILFSILAHNIWFFGNGILTNSDTFYFHKESKIGFPSVYTWNSMGMNNFGSYGIENIPRIVYLLPYDIMSNLGIPYNFILRIVFLWPLAILSSFLSFLFIYRLSNSKLTAVAGSVLYSYNTYFLKLNASHLSIAMAYVLLPLSLLLFFKLHEKYSIRQIIIASLAFFIICLFDIRVAYICSVIYLIYTILFAIFYGKWKFILKLNISFYFIISLLLSFFLIPLIFSKGLESAFLLKRQLFGNHFLNILNPLALFHPFWTGSRLAYFQVQRVNFVFLLIPLLIFILLLFNKKRGKKNSLILFTFIITTLIGIFLSKQVAAPFGFFYEWLFNNFPGFNAFREASKFFILVSIGYSVLFGYTINELYLKIKGASNRKRVALIFTVLVLGIILINVKPLIIRDYNLHFERQLPEEYLILKNKIILEDPLFNTMVIPSVERWHYISMKYPSISLLEIILNQWDSSLSFNKSYVRYDSLLSYTINDSNFLNLLKVSNIKYLILSLDTDENYEFYDKDLLKKQLIFYKDFNLEQIGNLYVFQNKDYLPHIYLSSLNQSLEKLDKSKIYNLEHKQINPTKYYIKSNYSEPFYLYFSESYHPQWMITQKSNWISGFSDKNYLFDETHFKAYGFLNSWYVDPAELEKSSDGNYVIYLYFKPQSYFYLGLIISGTTLISCVGYLVYDWRKNRKLKNINKNQPKQNEKSI